MSEKPQINSATIRRSGAFKTVIGFVVTAILVALVIFLSSRGFQFKNPFYLIPLGVPFAYFSIGMIEIITGSPFDRFAQAWMSLKGWQRGLLGTFIAVLAIIVIVSVVGLLAFLKIL